MLPQNMSHQPLYLQIKEALKKQILAGEYAPYQRMPSESELMNSFGVSRITVRQALRDLHSEGLIFTSQGKGTFASKPKAMQDVQHLEGLRNLCTTYQHSRNHNQQRRAGKTRPQRQGSRGRSGARALPQSRTRVG